MEPSISEQSIQNVGLRFGFAFLLIVPFFSLLTFAAVAPGAMGATALFGLPLSIILAFSLIVFCVLLTGTYVLIANKTAR